VDFFQPERAIAFLGPFNTGMGQAHAQRREGVAFSAQASKLAQMPVLRCSR